MTTIDILRLIIARSPDAAREGIGAIKALQSGSPMAARRAERSAQIALEDSEAKWTADERAQLAELLGTTGSDEPRNLDIRLRVSVSEKNEVQQAASEAGLTVSDYIRQAIGLSILD